MRAPLASLIVTLSLSLGAAAQSTWVVDALSRPGATHVDIQSAVNAAAPGDTIRVRDARPTVSAYAGASIPIGIALLAETQAEISSSLSIVGVPAGQRCSVTGFTLGRWTGVSVVVSQCAGEVHFEQVLRPPVNFFSFGGGFDISGCAHVTLTRCTSVSVIGLSCKGSSLLVVDSEIAGEGYYEQLGGPGIVASASRVTLAGTRVQGASTNSCCLAARPPQAGISSTGSTIVFSGSRTRILGGGVLASPCTCTTPEVGVIADAATTLIVDPVITFTRRGGALVSQLVPSSSATRLLSPGTLTLTLEAPAGAAFFTLVSFPAGPLQHALGDIWLDLVRAVVVDVGVTTGNTRVHQQAFPPLLPLGLALSWQSGVLSAGAPLLSTPTVSLLY